MVSRQFKYAKFLFGFQSNPSLLSGSQNSPTQLSLYLSLKIVYPYQVFIISKLF